MKKAIEMVQAAREAVAMGRASGAELNLAFAELALAKRDFITAYKYAQTSLRISQF